MAEDNHKSRFRNAWDAFWDVEDDHRAQFRNACAAFRDAAFTSLRIPQLFDWLDAKYDWLAAKLGGRRPAP